MFARFLFLIPAALLAGLFGAPRAGADSGVIEIRSADGSGRAIASLDTSVDLQINGLIAEVQVKQRFRNDGAAWLEGHYLLPLPEGAAVHALTLRIGQRLVVGEIREREAARSEYAQAVASGRKASLVEAHSANLFRTAVANVMPGEIVEVEIGYWQQVDFRDGEFALTLPLTYTPRYTLSVAPGAATQGETVSDSTELSADEAAHTQAANERQAESTAELPAPGPSLPAVRVGAPTVTIQATLDAGLPLARVESDTHALSVHLDGRRHRIELQDLVVAADRDFVLRWTPTPSATPSAALLREAGSDEQFALLMLVPPSQPAAPLPRELILVIDTSGSMQGQSIVQARAALDLALQQLKPQDRFNVIDFDSQTTTLFDTAVAATPEAVARARAWVAGLAADGGTDMLPALQAALRGDPAPGYLRQVVFVTDGAVDQAEQLYLALETQLGASRVFPVGIGSAPNGEFLRKAAELGRGSAVIVRQLDEVGERMQALFAKLDRPALRDLQLSLPVAAEVYPQRLPDLYHGEPLLLIARLPAQAVSGKALIEGQLAGAPWSQSLQLDLQGQARGLGRLWAQRKIEALEDAQRRGGDATALRDELVALALRHHLVSRHTSLVAVDRTPHRAPTEPLQTVDVENAEPAGSLGFAQTATSARLYLALGLLALLLAFVLRRDGRAISCRST